MERKMDEMLLKMLLKIEENQLLPEEPPEGFVVG